MTRRIRAPRADQRLVRCPIIGCREQLPIDPAQADQPYTCPCERRAELEVHLRGAGTDDPAWELVDPLSPLRLPHDVREVHNLIAHALVAGQVTRDARTRPRTQVGTAANEHAQRESGAFLAAYREMREACVLLTMGHPVAAHDHATRGLAAAVAYEAHASALRREDRQLRAETLWQGGGTFYVDVPLTPEVHLLDAGKVGPQVVELPRFQRMEFDFVAIEGAREIEVVDGEATELLSGIRVGADGWRDLVRLLTRLEVKPGTDVDTQHLIYRPDHGTLQLRRHVRERYPRAVVALEALRQTLRPQVQPQGLTQATQDWFGSAAGYQHRAEPDWVRDALAAPTVPAEPGPDRPPESRYAAKRRIRMSGS